MPSLRFVRDKYIKQWSTHAYKMEYGGYLSNHLLHGLVALADLGASEAHIDAFASRYVSKLCEVTDREKDVKTPALSLQEAKRLLGKRTNFEGLRAMYAAEIQQSTADDAVRKHLPTLVDGLAGALLHGIIQLGYAFHVGGDQLIAEGLAYLHFSHLSFAAPGDEDDEDVLVRDGPHEEKKPFTREAALTLARAVQKESSLLEELYARLKAPELANTTQGYLQRRLMAFSSDKERGDPVLFGAVANAVDQFDFSEMNGRTAIDFAVWLFSIAPTNDFVLLHATTSAWSLGKLEHLLAEDDRVRAWKVWFRMALSAFIMHEIPELPANDPCEEAELKLATMPQWDVILAKSLALEGDVDEHVYKMVQVAYDVAKQGSVAGTTSGDPSNTTTIKKTAFLTPAQREFVARSAALKVVSESFSDLQLNHDV